MWNRKSKYYKESPKSTTDTHICTHKSLRNTKPETKVCKQENCMTKNIQKHKIKIKGYKDTIQFILFLPSTADHEP